MKTLRYEPGPLAPLTPLPEAEAKALLARYWQTVDPAIALAAHTLRQEVAEYPSAA